MNREELICVLSGKHGKNEEHREAIKKGQDNFYYDGKSTVCTLCKKETLFVAYRRRKTNFSVNEVLEYFSLPRIYDGGDPFFRLIGYI